MRGEIVISVLRVMKEEGPRVWTMEDLEVDSAMELPEVEIEAESEGSVHLEKTDSRKAGHQ